MSYGESNIYLEPKLARSYHVVDIDIDEEPVYSEITSEPELTPPQKQKNRMSKSESAFFPRAGTICTHKNKESNRKKQEQP